MNTDHIRALEQVLDQIERLDIGTKLAEQHSGKDLNTISWFEMSAFHLASLTARVIVQMRAEIEGGEALLYPSLFSVELQNQGCNNRDILNLFREFYNYCNASQWQQAVIWLKGIINYQMVCGFWDRSTKRLHSMTKLQRQEIFSDLEVRQRQVDKVGVDASQTLSSLQTSVGAIKATKDEVTQILGAIRKSNEEVASLLTQAAGQEGKLEEILKAQEGFKASTEDYLNKIEDNHKQFLQHHNDAKKELLEAQRIAEWIKQQERLVNELAGTSAAGILGKKFEERQNELGKTAFKWLFVILSALIVDTIWFFMAHKYLIPAGLAGWELAGFNIGLAIPGVVLVLFVIAQYLKERHFQEEYAFRSAVAMTMKAFADEMEQGNPDRNIVLKDALAKIYQHPAGLITKSERSPFVAPKTASELLKAATELVKEVKK